MTDNTITCDNCGKRIVRSNCEDYYLHLSQRDKPQNPDNCTVTLMHISPQLDATKDFCGMTCLCQWAAKQKSPWTWKEYAS